MLSNRSAFIVYGLKKSRLFKCRFYRLTALNNHAEAYLRKPVQRGREKLVPDSTDSERSSNRAQVVKEMRRLIIVEGNIGVGKTTLSNRLGELLNYKVGVLIIFLTVLIEVFTFSFDFSFIVKLPLLQFYAFSLDTNHIIFTESNSIFNS